VLVSKDPTLHTQLIPMISREVQISKQIRNRTEIQRHRYLSHGSAKPEMLAYIHVRVSQLGLESI
jgi:hypothetical protein